MTKKPVEVLLPETHSQFTGDTAKSVVACTISKNALAADQTDIISVPNFKAVLPVVNQEGRFTIVTPEGEKLVDHRFLSEEDLEANARVDSKSIPKAGALFRIPETRAMLIKKAFLSEFSNRLKDNRCQSAIQVSLRDTDKAEYIQVLRSKAKALRNLSIEN